MVVVHPGIPAANVAEVVRREWGLEVTGGEHADVGTGRRHWSLRGADLAPAWLASLEAVRGEQERRAALAALEAAARVARRLSFVVAPVRTRDGRLGVDLGPGLLLTLAPYLEGAPLGAGRFRDDDERCVVASMMGELHRQPRPDALPVWGPGPPSAHREELDGLLAAAAWTGGPWAVPARRLVHELRVILARCVRRRMLLGPAVHGGLGRWVVTHGQAHPAHVLRTPDGARLVRWSTTALAPRERDLGEVLGGAEGSDPWYAYVEAGGPPEPLSPDAVELFALEAHLSRLFDHARRFAGPHEDTAEERRCFGELEQRVSALLEGWG